MAGHRVHRVGASGDARGGAVRQRGGAGLHAPGADVPADDPLDRLYTPADVEEGGYEARLGSPGRYPFTRGPYPTMYRAQPWSMRQIAGFGTAGETNRRFTYLIARGQTGISCDFDMPTLMGYDSDDPRSAGEVGREGVAIDTLADFEELFERRGSPMSRKSSSTARHRAPP